MEKLSFVRNGVIKLPPGFRFHPTDEELVVQYLRRKVFACPLPASIIPEINVCKYDPCDLPGDSGQERYFFSTREVKYSNGNRSNRASGSGYWKATGVDKQIMSSRSNRVVGMKKTLVFYRGKSPKGSRTDWIMHEYRLVDAEIAASIFPDRKNSIQNTRMPMEDWVLCRIFLKKRNCSSTRNEDEERNVMEARPKFIDFLKQDRKTDLGHCNSPSSTSEATSGITEASSTASDGEETSSSNNSFSLFPCTREA